MKKSDGRKLPVAVLEERRIIAAKLRAGGMALAEVSARVSLSPPTIIKAHKAYVKGGEAAVRLKPRGRSKGQKRLLTRSQEASVRESIRDRMPDQLKMDFSLWTRGAVAGLIAARFGVQLPVRTVGLYLERWGFTPQKPLTRAYERNPVAVKRWLEETYPAIAQKAKREKSDILRADETGMRTDDVRGLSFSPKGITPERLKPARREGFSMISAVTNKGAVRRMIYEGALNSAVLLEFLRRLLRGAKRKIHLILDNLKVHHSRPVKEWLATNRREIEAHYLPAYSPELNPDELLNSDLKRIVAARAPSRAKPALKRAVAAHMRALRGQPDKIASFFRHPDVAYAA